MIAYHMMNPDEISGLAAIDRSDRAAEWYRVRDGRLIREQRAFRHNGFSKSGWDEITQDFEKQLLADELVLIGAREKEKWVGVGGLDISRSYGPGRNLFNMGPIWVTASHRGQGIGSRLFDLIVEQAGKYSIAGLYISATPVPSTVDFYLQKGCRLLSEPDPELYQAEPEDIHLMFEFSSQNA